MLYLASADIAGPNGRTTPRLDEPFGLSVESITTGLGFDRYAPLRRARQEWCYGRALVDRIGRFAPGVVLSANTPLVSQYLLEHEAAEHRRRFLYWFQDSYGIGVTRVLTRHSRVAAGVGGRAVQGLERRLLRRSDSVIAIAPALADLARAWGVTDASIEVIANWAPLGPDDDGPCPSQNTPSRWGDAPYLLYTGTLGLKHDVELLVAVARQLEGRAGLVVVSEGPGRQQLERRRQELALSNLVLSDYLSRADLAVTMAGAVALVAILRDDSGSFSVPSKVYAYLAAGRPVLAAIPRDNEAARVLRRSGGGICVDPHDAEGLSLAALQLLDDLEGAGVMGAAARDYAVANFAVGPIADRFEALMVGPRPPTASSTAAHRVVARTLARLWTHPANQGNRVRAVGRYVAWQLWQRTIARPWTLAVPGGLEVVCHPHDPVASAVIYSGGWPDHEEMRFMQDYLAAGDTMVDVGANIGLYTLSAASVPGVHVLCLEPGSTAFTRLMANISLNALHDRVTAHRLAAGRWDDVALLSTERGPMNSIVSAGAEPVEKITVAPLDSLVAEEPVALVKIDVEGHELEVLAGAVGLIATRRPALIVEVNDQDGVEEFCSRFDYTSVAYRGESRTITPVPVSTRVGANAILVADFEAAAGRLAR